MKFTFRRFGYCDFHVGLAFKMSKEDRWVRVALGKWMLAIEL
jgi:hypothetical protein